MDGIRVFGALILIAATITHVFGVESSLRISVEDQDAGTSCIYSLPGDPTDWVPKASLDSEYEVALDPFCVDSASIQLGALAVNPSQPDVVLASDRLDQSIMYFQMTADGDVQSFFQSALNVTGIAVDYQSQNLYYTDPEVGIMMMEVGVSQPRYDVLIKDLDDPHDIFVDPDQGYLFWAEKNTVKRAKLSGSSVKTILTGISRDSLITLDTDSRLLFVLDQTTGCMRSMKYDGSGVKTLFTDPANYTEGMFSGLTADQGYIFGAVADKAEIAIWDQVTGKRLVHLSFLSANVKQFGITVNKAESKSSTGRCAQNKGGCSQMCVHESSASRSCKCEFGYSLQPDGVSCQPGYPEINFALVTDIGSDAVYQVDIHSGSVNKFPIAHQANRRIEDAVYDSVNKAIIWIDTGNGALKSKMLTPNAAEITLFTFSEESIIESIAYDEKEHVVYYTDSELSRIGKVSADGGHEIILNLTADELPLKLQLDTDAGYIYWTNVGSRPSIERALMSDVNKRDVLVNSELENPTGLTLNVSESRLYWIDSEKQRIEVVDLNGSGRKMVEPDTEAYSISLDPDFLFVARQHDIRRYSASGNASSTLGPKIFSMLNSIKVYLGEDDKDSSDASRLVTDLTNHMMMMMICLTWLLWQLA